MSGLIAAPPAQTDRCKLCGGSSRLAFGLPSDKLTGRPIPEKPDDCWYYVCASCDFCYTRALDDKDQGAVYDDDYWTIQDSDWYGRVPQTLRLASLANELLGRHLADLDILDFGCGSGGFVEIARRDLLLNAWGTDIVPPKLGRRWFLPELGDRRFDIVVACEVIEHLPDPRATFDHIRAHLKAPGVFAFQTAQWQSSVTDRDWWYLGPANGHISLYGAPGLTHVFEAMGGRERRVWGGYPGLQAWLFDDEPGLRGRARRLRRRIGRRLAKPPRVA